MAPHPAFLAHGRVKGNSKQPSGKSGIALERLQLLERQDKRLLDGIPGFFRRTEELHHAMKQALLMAFDKCAKRLAFARAASLDEIVIGKTVEGHKLDEFPSSKVPGFRANAEISRLRE